MNPNFSLLIPKSASEALPKGEELRFLLHHPPRRVMKDLAPSVLWRMIGEWEMVGDWARLQIANGK